MGGSTVDCCKTRLLQHAVELRYSVSLQHGYGRNVQRTGKSFRGRHRSFELHVKVLRSEAVDIDGNVGTNMSGNKVPSCNIALYSNGFKILPVLLGPVSRLPDFLAASYDNVHCRSMPPLRWFSCRLPGRQDSGCRSG